MIGMDSSTGKLCINEWQALKAGVTVKSLQGNHWLRTIVCIKSSRNATLKEIYVKMIHGKKTGRFYSKNCPCKAVLLAVIKITGIQAAHPALKDVCLRLQKDILKYRENNPFYYLYMANYQQKSNSSAGYWGLHCISIFQQMIFTL